MSYRASAKLDSVQILRALAALMVVFGHVLGTVERFPNRFGPITHFPYAGGAGVDIFFLVSGFIMVFASRRMFGSATGAREFVLRRLVRIVPPYWTATIVMLLVLLTKSMPLSPSAVVASFVFWPFDTTSRGDGIALHLLDLGWTLNYEMLFYVVFALFIPLGRLRGVWGVAIVMALLVLIRHAVSPANIAPYFWTRGIILEFVAGMAVAVAYGTGRLWLPPAARSALVVAAVALYILDPVPMMGQAMTPNDAWRVVGWGLPAMLLLVAAVAGPASFISRPARWAMLLGDASYVLYLLHPFILILMIQLFRHLTRPGGVTPLAFVGATVVLSCTAAIAVHIWIERPAVTRLTRLLQRRDAPIDAAGRLLSADDSRL